MPSVRIPIAKLRWSNVSLGRCSLPLGAWDRLHYFIVSLPGPTYNYFTRISSTIMVCSVFTAVRAVSVSFPFGNFGITLSSDVSGAI